MRKDGGYYWVFANITASVDTNNNIIGYYSVRRKPSRKGLEAIIPVYKQLVDAEKRGGMKASEKILNDFLKQNNTTYEELVTSLQAM